MEKKILPTFLGNRLNFELPHKWGEFSQEQLKYVFFLMATFPQITAQTYLFFRLLGIKVHCHNDYGWLCSYRFNWHKRVKFFMQEWEIQFWQKKLNWLYTPTSEVARLAKIRGRQAVSSCLHGVSFDIYLKCENCYQGYLYSKNIQALEMMANMLYIDNRPHLIRRLFPTRWKEEELFSVFIWWSSLKQLFAEHFKHFFRSVGDANIDEVPDMENIMNTQIRALTGGDVTKEREILSMDCWRALTELNAKARDAKRQQEELKKMQNK